MTSSQKLSSFNLSSGFKVTEIIISCDKMQSILIESSSRLNVSSYSVDSALFTSIKTLSLWEDKSS